MNMKAFRSVSKVVSTLRFEKMFQNFQGIDRLIVIIITQTLNILLST
jgi:hypothetical protein